MLRIPPVRAAIVVGKRRLVALERHVGTAQDGLPHIINTVDHMPMVVIRDWVARFDPRVGLGNGELAGG